MVMLNMNFVCFFLWSVIDLDSRLATNQGKSLHITTSVLFLRLSKLIITELTPLLLERVLAFTEPQILTCEGVDDLSAHHVVFVIGRAETRMSSMEVEQQVTFVRG